MDQERHMSKEMVRQGLNENEKYVFIHALCTDHTEEKKRSVINETGSTLSYMITAICSQCS